MNDSSEEFEDFESSGSEFVPSTDTECDSNDSELSDRESDIDHLLR